MNNNNFGRFAAVATLFAIIFSGCKKESFTPDQSHVSSTTAASGDALITYYSCNQAVNVFVPPANIHYSFALQSGKQQYQKYGVPRYRYLDFENIDRFLFEFSGVYADKARLIKLYRIRRTDGLYLTWPVQWVSKQEGASSKFQLWLLSNIGSNKYNLILPKMGTECLIMRTYYQTGWETDVVPMDGTIYTGTTDIFMFSNEANLP